MRLIAVLSLLVLAACQTTVGNIETQIQNNLPLACKTIAAADVSFKALVASKAIKHSVLVKEKAAMKAVGALCADPSNVTASNALIIAANAYASIVSALADAKK